MSASVSSLFIYPIKGCQGIALTQAIVEQSGLRHDRRWMLADAQTGGFLSQRSHPALARLTVAVRDTGDLTAGFGDGYRITIPYVADDMLAARDVTVWKFTGGAVDVGDDAASFFSESLKHTVRLVRVPGAFTRRVNPQYATTADDSVGFADGYPILVASEPSLADLNQRLNVAVPMNRFRPNVVISGDFDAWAEDNWVTVHIGDALCRNAKPCGRCSVTTIDQFTGESTGSEPLSTLAKFRRDPGSNNVNFGANLIPDRKAIGCPIRIGDPVKMG